MSSHGLVTKSLLSLVLGAAAIAAPTSLWAHALAPAYLDIEEFAVHRYQVTWKTARARFGNSPQPQLPERCARLAPPVLESLPDAFVARWQIDCGDTGLPGQRIRVSHLAENAIDALVVFTALDGARYTSTLRSGEPSWQLPLRPSRLATFERYLWLGFRHILEGVDHLAFLFALVLLVRRAQVLAAAVTGFTAGHCVTLSLVAMDRLQAPAGAEALIALTVVLVARELLGSGVRPGLVARFPWLIAMPLGLLHGLGFAGALAAIGLPAAAALPALAGFNVGVELGQLLFIALLLGAGTIARAWWPWPGRVVTRTAAYGLGTFGAFWTLQRVAVAV